MVSAGHAAHASSNNTPAPWAGAGLATPFFASLLDFGGKAQHVTCSDQRIKARLHHGDGGLYLWVANPTRTPVPVRVGVGQAWGPFSATHTLWGAEATCSGSTLELTAPARDMTVLELT
jgi:hypothetical protein